MDNRVFQGMEYVYEVYKAGSFRQAAENLYVSQPSISASVRRIEERLGCTLFDRGVKPLKLTECGEQYIAAVEQIQVMERNFVEYVNDLYSLRRGSLVVGGSSFFSSLVLPPMVTAFSRQYPHVKLELVEKTTLNLEYFLSKGSIDMIIDYEIPHSELYSSELLAVEHLLLAVPRSNPINASLKSYRLDSKRLMAGEEAIDSVPPVPLAKFRDEAFILMKEGNDSRRRADNMFHDAGISPRVILEFDQQMTNYHVSCSGIGICVASSVLVRLLEPSHDMVYYRLGSEEAKRRIYLFWRQDRYITRAMEEFRRIATGTQSTL